MAFDKIKWLESDDGKQWKAQMDQAVKDGIMTPAMRDAVLSPGVPYVLSRPRQFNIDQFYRRFIRKFAWHLSATSTVPFDVALHAATAVIEQIKKEN